MLALRPRASRTAAAVVVLSALTLPVIDDVRSSVSTAQAADVARVDCDPLVTSAGEPVRQLASFTGATPRRLVDTRDGTGGLTGPVQGGCVLRIDVDAAGIPAEASALSLSVTALGERAGFQQVFPCAAGRPATSNVNNRPAAFPTPNLVIGLPDQNRELCVFTLFDADLLVDLSGWWTEEGGQRFRAVEPVRVDDSRDDAGPIPGGSAPRPIDLAALVPPGTTSIVANLTVTQPTATGFLVIFPCGTAAPTASNLNFLPGESRAVSVVVGLDADRQVCTSSNVDHELILDLAGYYGPAPRFGPAAELRPESGTRLADSRDGTGGWTTPIGAGETRSLEIAGTLPDGPQVTGVVLNVTVTDHTRPGFLRVTRCGAESDISSVNYLPGGAFSNLVVVDLGTSTSICVFSLEEAEVIVDLFGVLRAESDLLLTERFEVRSDTWPPYRPDAPNYVTECADPLELDLDLLAGTRARVNGVSVTSGLTQVDLATADDLVRVEFRRGADVQRHQFQCVPDDFRRLSVFAAAERDPGWYVMNVPTDGIAPARVLILDEFGAPVWYVDTPENVPVAQRANNGELLLVPSRGSRFSVDPDRGAVRARLDGSVIAEFVSVDSIAPPTSGAATENPTDHHDIVELANGGVALISYPLYENVDLRSLSTLDDGIETDVITDNLIQEIDAAGALVWEWRMSDHFVFAPPAPPGTADLEVIADEVPFPQRWDVAGGYDGVDDVDVFHINSIELAGDGSGDYIVSARHLDAIFRIERATGDVLWIVRSDEVTAANASGAPVLTITDDPRGGPRRPHDAILDGNVLTFFDNRTGTGQPARAVTYLLDTTAGTATLIDSIEQQVGQTSLGLGSFRLADDGSRLVAWGAPIQPTIQEFGPTGQIDLSIALPGGGSSYRAVRYEPDAFNLLELRATTGRVLDLPD